VGVFSARPANAQHPRLALTQEDVVAMKENLGKYAMFNEAYADAQQTVERALAKPIDVPVPRDAGGYTHERHKKNYGEMYAAGVLYAVTKDARYAEFVRAMLLKYAELYPTLDRHPAATSKKTFGKLFWQALNENVWLVNTAQAYDCVYDALTAADRTTIESKVLRPMAEFLSNGDELDLIHNHGTWNCAAVGMAGYVLGDKNLVEKALYGTKKKKEGGFLRQMELLFSPDGFYTEGPYYVRYALQPFYLFAQAIDHFQPELNIFEYRGQILKKGLYAGLQLTYTNGAFLPINDALKEKTFLSPELVIAVDIAYKRYGADQNLLGVAMRQSSVMLSAAGVAVARDAAAHLASANARGNYGAEALPEVTWKSLELSDGAKGDEGGVGVFRSGDNTDQSLLCMKYTGHGLSHGHYDKLSFLYYDQGREILQDYGAARFINVEPKFGGRYLPETKGFAMQTIAHNTLIVDGESHYGGLEEVSERFHADRHFYSNADSMLQVMSAKCTTAYNGVKMQRTMAMVRDARLAKPVVIDVMRVLSDREHTYDLPYYYLGHFLTTNVAYTAHDKERRALGTKNGYQYLWNEADGFLPPKQGSVRFTWMAGNRYYSLVTAADSATHTYFTRIGAGDPNFNLRNEPAIMLRQKARNYVFASVIEPHGRFDGTREFSEGATGVITDVRVLASTDEATIVEVLGANGLKWAFAVVNGQANEATAHSVNVNGTKYEWKGNYALLKMK
jgi:hypothetical protein